MKVELKDRPRLMALVFGLRLTVLSLVFLVVSSAILAANFTETREWESLLVLFSLFQFMVATVLVWVRFQNHLSRVLLLLPALCLVFPSWKWQLWGAVVGGAVALEAFRSEADSKWFFGAQIVLLLTAGGLLFYPAPLIILLGSTVSTLGYGIGCWEWQRVIKQSLKELD